MLCKRAMKTAFFNTIHVCHLTINTPLIYCVCTVKLTPDLECQCHVLLSIGLVEYVNIHKINSLRLKVCEICRFHVYLHYDLGL